MASAQEMVRLFNDGALGTFLIETFGGRLGDLHPRKDADFVIIYDSEDGVPESSALRERIERFYTGKGYIVKMGRPENGSVVGMIRYQETDAVWVNLNITTHWPLQSGKNNAIRVSCNVVA